MISLKMDKESYVLGRGDLKMLENIFKEPSVWCLTI